MTAVSLPQATGRFTRRQRLIHRGDFARVFAAPCRSSDRYFTVLFRPNNLHVARLGLAITKKRVRRAVARNRVRRHVRQSFRLHQSLLYGMDLVVIARIDLSTVSNSVLVASLSRHWENLHIHG